MVYIKSGYGNNARFAALLEPRTPNINSDLELFSLVTINGFALIQRLTPNCELDGNPERLTPHEFEQQWRGD